MEYITCKESKRCFAQVTDRGRTCCKILLTNYQDGKCPFFKVKAYDKPRRIEKEAGNRD